MIEMVDGSLEQLQKHCAGLLAYYHQIFYEVALIDYNQIMHSIQKVMEEADKLVGAITRFHHYSLTVLLNSKNIQSVLNQPVTQSGLTFLQLAIQVENEWAVGKLLLEQNANPNVHFGNSSSPLWMAMQLKASPIRDAICNLLLFKSANINERTPTGMPLWQFAQKPSYLLLYFSIKALYPLLSTNSTLERDYCKESHALGLRRKWVFDSKNHMTSTLSNIGVPDPIKGLFNREIVRENFEELYTMEAIKPLLEMIQLAHVGFSHLKESFLGFYLNNIASPNLYYYENIIQKGNPKRFIYLNIAYDPETGGFNIDDLIRRCILFAVQEVYQNRGYPYYAWDPKGKELMERTLMNLRLVGEPSSPEELLSSLISNLRIRDKQPSLLNYYFQFIKDCKNHCLYLRAKNGIFEGDLQVEPAKNIGQSAAAMPAPSAVSF